MTYHRFLDLSGRRVLLATDDGPLLATEQAILDLIGEALGEGAEWIATPASRLAPAFFDLKSGLAGAILQKTTNYRLGFAVLGDIPAEALQSEALRAFIIESNGRGEVLFLPDLAALEIRMVVR
jgi:hypothetical protein